MQLAIACRISHLEHLIAQQHLLAVPEVDLTRILPSGWRSITIVMRSDVASFSSIFSGSSSCIIVPSRGVTALLIAAGPPATGVAPLQVGYEIDAETTTDRNVVTLGADAPRAFRRQRRSEIAAPARRYCPRVQSPKPVAPGLQKPSVGAGVYTEKPKGPSAARSPTEPRGGSRTASPRTSMRNPGPRSSRLRSSDARRYADERNAY
jgi:hypothetical protein